MPRGSLVGRSRSTIPVESLLGRKGDPRDVPGNRWRGDRPSNAQPGWIEILGNSSIGNGVDLDEWGSRSGPTFGRHEMSNRPAAMDDNTAREEATQPLIEAAIGAARASRRSVHRETWEERADSLRRASFQSNDETDDVAVHHWLEQVHYEQVLDVDGEVIDTELEPRRIGWAHEKLALQLAPGSIKSSIFTLVITIMGTGVLSLPYAFLKSGVILGIILVAICSGLLYFSVQLLIACRDRSQITTYPGLAFVAMGTPAAVFTTVILLLNLFGAGVSYLVALGNIAPTIVKDLTGWKYIFYEHGKYINDSSIIIAAIVCFVQLPLGFKRELSSLRFTSLLAFFCIVYLVAYVTLNYFNYCIGDGVGTAHCIWEKGFYKEVNLFSTSWSDIMTSLPIMVYAFTCHPYVLPIFQELHHPIKRRMEKVLYRATFLSAGLYLSMGLFGYLTFLNKTNGNILLNNFQHSSGYLLGCLGICSSVTLTMPLLVNTMRRSLQLLYHARYEDATHIPPLGTLAHVTVTVVLLVLAFLTAVVVPDLSLAFGLLGSTVNPMVCFILPALFYLKIYSPGENTLTRLAAVFMAVTMFGFGVIGLVQVIRIWK